jgi:dTDP-4-dehydrorhamnose 3,5-epimerase
MKFTHSKLAVVIIELDIHLDGRGYFAETFRQDKLEAFIGHEVNFVQENQSQSGLGVLRGLHYQLPPVAQCKLVSVIKGKILDVVVDIRKNSPDFGKYFSCILSEENKTQIYIPAGFAHGFLALEEGSIINYKANNYYSLAHERGIAFDDPDIGIVWAIKKHKIQVSNKDKNQPLLKNADLFGI